MKRNVTLSVDADDIDLARQVARESRMSLNDAFRQWLKEFTGRNRVKVDVRKTLEKFSTVQIGRRFTRAEMNER